MKESRDIGLDRFMSSNISGMDSSEFSDAYGYENVQLVIDGIPYPMPAIDIKEREAIDRIISGGKISYYSPNYKLTKKKYESHKYKRNSWFKWN